MNNYRALFGLRVLKNILYCFQDSFLALYFLQLSNNNILPFGIYKLTSMIVVFLVVFSLRNLCKAKHRVRLLRIGIFLDFIYFLAIVLLREKVVDYIYLIGILYGLEEGFYYSVYNIFESDGIDNKQRAKFIGTYTSVQSILSVIFPLIFGSLIYKGGFLLSIILVLIIVGIRIIISFVFKDIIITTNTRTNFKEYGKIVDNNPGIRQMYKVNFFDGLTYSSGALSSIITIYIIKVFSDSFSLGIFTSIFSIITSIIGILFAKCIKESMYKTLIKISMSFTIVTLVCMVFKCNMVTVIVFNLFQTFSKTLTDLINVKTKGNISNIGIVKKKYKVEFWIGNEFFLFMGRVVSQTLFIIMAFIENSIVVFIFLFIGFLIMLLSNSLKLQTRINNIDKKEEKSIEILTEEELVEV